MNNTRRTEIKKCVDVLQTILVDLESIKSDEEYAFDSMPEGLQSSDRGMNSEESIELLDNAIELLEGCIDNLSDIN